MLLLLPRQRLAASQRRDRQAAGQSSRWTGPLRFRYARAEPRLRRLPSLALRLLSMLTPTATTFRYPAGALLQPRQRPQRADGADFCGTSSAARPCLAGQSAVSIHAKVRASTKRECKISRARAAGRTLSENVSNSLSLASGKAPEHQHQGYRYNCWPRTWRLMVSRIFTLSQAPEFA
jgi:hypothetical protein